MDEDGNALLEEKKLSHSKRYILFAYVLAFLSVVLDSISLPCVQILDDIVPKFELNAWRFAAQITLLLPVVGKNKCDVRVSIKQWPVLLILCIDNTLYNLFHYYAAVYLPVGTLVGLNKGIVLVVNVIISIFRKTDRKLFLYVSSVLVIISVLFITQPDFIFAGSGLYINSPATSTNWTSPCRQPYISNLTTTDTNLHSRGLWIGYIIITVSGILSAIEKQIVNYIVQSTSPLTVSFWMAISGVVGSLICMGILEEPILPSSSFCIVLLLVHIYTVGQYSIMTTFCLKVVRSSTL